MTAAPDFEYYTGPATGVGMGYQFAPGMVLRVDLAQVGAVGLSRWTLPDATPVYLQSTFRATHTSFQFQRELTRGRLRPYLGLGAAWRRLAVGQSQLLVGRGRLTIANDREIQQWDWGPTGGLRLSLGSKAIFAVEAQWLTSGNWFPQFGVQQMLIFSF